MKEENLQEVANLEIRPLLTGHHDVKICGDVN